MNTPAYIIDTKALTKNALILDSVRQRTGCRILLALKAFSMPSAFPYFQPYLNGTCASSVHEARLGMTCFKGETHAFAAAFTHKQMVELLDMGVEHMTFNSFTQYRQFRDIADRHANGSNVTCGLRINPEHSEGRVPIYDPCAPHSRLGIRHCDFEGQSLEGITGLHCHNLCEQNADSFVRTLHVIEEKFGDMIDRMDWFNFGGGHHITREDYDIDLLCDTLNSFNQRHPGKTLYLEPGEACALNAGTLVTSVLDIVNNEGDIAILDMSCACHTPDVMEMPYRPRVCREANWQGSATPSINAEHGLEPNESPSTHPYLYRLAGPTCLSGDIIGEYAFATPLKLGDQLIFEDMALYTMVKNNTFNGINLPDIMFYHENCGLETVRTFGYDDFMSRL